MRRRSLCGIPAVEEASEIDEAGLVAACGEAEIGARDFPAAMAVGNFEAERLRMLVTSLRHGDIDRRVGRMQPAARDEPERAARRQIVAQVDFDVMVARDALILAAAEGVEILAVEIAKRFCYIVARDRRLRARWRAARQR